MDICRLDKCCLDKCHSDSLVSVCEKFLLPSNLEVAEKFVVVVVGWGGVD